MLKLLVIPGIDIHNGMCTYCISGNEGMEQLYDEFSKNPDKLCSLLRRENSRSIFVKDNDSFTGDFDNSDILLQIPKAVEIPLVLYINRENFDDYSWFLNRGYYRVMIDDIVYTNPDDTRKLIDKFGCSRIIFGFLGKNGVRNLPDGTKITIDDFIEQIKPYKPQRLVYGDDQWIERNEPDNSFLLELSKKLKCRVTLYNTVNSPHHLWKLTEIAPQGIDSVIIGKPIFDNNFPCQKLWRFAESLTEPELQGKDNNRQK